MKESEVKKFYEKNKSYCSMPFKKYMPTMQVVIDFVATQMTKTLLGNIKQQTLLHLKYFILLKWMK